MGLLAFLALLLAPALGGEEQGPRTIPIDVPQDPLERREGGLQTALADARASGRMVLLELATAWCTWCRRFESETLGHPLARRALADAIVVVLDAESPEGRPVARRFGVRSYPTLIVFDAAGEPQDRIGGFLDHASLARELERVRRGEDTLGGWARRIAADPDDLDARLARSAKLRTLGDEAGARAELAEIGRRDPEARSAAGELARLEGAKNEVLAAWQRTQAIDLGSIERFLAAAKQPAARCEAFVYVARTRHEEARRLAGRAPAARLAELRADVRAAWLDALETAPPARRAEVALELARSFAEQGAEAGEAALARAAEVLRATLAEAEPWERAEGLGVLSLVLEKLERRGEALGAARAALELEPGDPRRKRRVAELGG